MSAPLSRFLLAAACSAVALGAWQATRQLPWSFEAPDPHPGWVARYEALAPAVDAAPRVLFLQEEQGRGLHRLFRAQFVLAPSVIEERSSIDRVQIGQLTQRPLILDYRRPRALRRTLERLRDAAAERGLELEVDRPFGQLAVVRARRPGRR